MKYEFFSGPKPWNCDEDDREEIGADDSWEWLPPNPDLFVKDGIDWNGNTFLIQSCPCDNFVDADEDNNISDHDQNSVLFNV